MEKLSFTLYEIFGYFLPGVVGITATVILFWTLFLPGVPIPIHSVELSKLWYLGLVVVAYYAGHVLQDMSRSLFKIPDHQELMHRLGLTTIIARVQAELATHLGMAQSHMPEIAVTVKLCDELSVQYGRIGDRDVFVYREGFYRGSFAAFLLLDLTLIVRTIVPGAALQLSRLFPISHGELIFLVIVVSGSAFFLLQRYKHFAALRVMHGILATVCLLDFQFLSEKAAAPKKQ